jgi:hypothetical protein
MTKPNKRTPHAKARIGISPRDTGDPPRFTEADIRRARRVAVVRRLTGRRP